MNGFSPGTHLLLVIATPLVGAVVAWLLGSRGLHAVRQSAAVTAVITLAGAAWLVVRYLRSPEAALGEPYAVVTMPWLVSGIFDVRLSLGLDGLSLWLFGLSSLLSLTAVLVCWEAVRERPVGFYSLLLVLEAAMLGVFAARDVILFWTVVYRMVASFIAISSTTAECRLSSDQMGAVHPSM